MPISTKPYKGTRDFYPDEMAFRQWMFGQLKQTVESYGYHEYDGPMLESFEVYAAKTGEEIVNQQLYHFEDRGNRKVAMRPEMTPTLARMVAGRLQELPKPVRWYSLPNLWRYERPQRGRLREHWQLNVDLLGGDNIYADCEVLQMAFDIIKSFNGTEFIKIKINNRKLINHFFNDQLGLTPEQALKASKAVDAKDKIGDEAFRQKLTDAEISDEKIKQLEDYFNLSLEQTVDKYPCEGSRELAGIFQQFESSPEVLQALQYDPQIMRGLDYYTGTVFEVFDVSPDNNRAMFGGGRYDNLIGLFGKQSLSGIGFGMGDVTLQNFLQTHELAPKDLVATVDVFLITTDNKWLVNTTSLARKLRGEGLRVVSPVHIGKLAQQFKAADKAHASYAVVLGEDEVQNNTVTIKNLKTGEQTEVPQDKITEHIQGQ